MTHEIIFDIVAEVKETLFLNLPTIPDRNFHAKIFSFPFSHLTNDGGDIFQLFISERPTVVYVRYSKILQPSKNNTKEFLCGPRVMPLDMQDENLRWQNGKVL